MVRLLIPVLVSLLLSCSPKESFKATEHIQYKRVCDSITSWKDSDSSRHLFVAINSHRMVKAGRVEGEYYVDFSATFLDEMAFEKAENYFTSHGFIRQVDDRSDGIPYIYFLKWYEEPSSEMIAQEMFSIMYEVFGTSEEHEFTLVNSIIALMEKEREDFERFR